MAPFFNRKEIQKGRCGKMSQDTAKGLRPRQYGGTNQLAEDRLERKALMSRGLRQGGKQILSADSLLKKMWGKPAKRTFLSGRQVYDISCGPVRPVRRRLWVRCVHIRWGKRSVWCNLCIYAEVVGGGGACYVSTLLLIKLMRCICTGGVGVSEKDSTKY